MEKEQEKVVINLAELEHPSSHLGLVKVKPEPGTEEDAKRKRSEQQNDHSEKRRKILTRNKCDCMYDEATFRLKEAIEELEMIRNYMRTNETSQYISETLKKMNRLIEKSWPIEKEETHETRDSMRRAVNEVKKAAKELSNHRFNRNVSQVIAKVKTLIERVKIGEQLHEEQYRKMARLQACWARKRFEINALPNEGGPLVTNDKKMPPRLGYKPARKN